MDENVQMSEVSMRFYEARSFQHRRIDGSRSTGILLTQQLIIITIAISFFDRNMRKFDLFITRECDGVVCKHTLCTV
jgi:hypothetical protein